MRIKLESMRQLSLGFLGAAIFTALFHGAPAVAQNVKEFIVRLQDTTPGTQQTGHSNITGTSIASQFQGGGAGLTGVNADLLDGLNSTAFLQVVPNPLNLSGSQAGLFIIKGANSDTAAVSSGVFGESTAAFGDTYGVYGRNSSTSGRGVYGHASASSGTNFGGYFSSNSTNGYGVYAESAGTYGVRGLSTLTSGTAFGGRFESDSTLGYGVIALSAGQYGVYGQSTLTSGTAYGGYFSSSSTSGRGVVGNALATSGTTYGGYFLSNSPDGYGVFATSVGNYGVRGEAASTVGRGVFGYGSHTGTTSTPYGVRGQASTATLGYAVFASGDMGASGVKPFRIDHPFDPENKYLLHYASESPFPQNFYNGNVVTDAQGYAWVELPDYFAEVNTHFKYVLTVVDDNDSDHFVQAKVSKKIVGNRFQIRTNAPHTEVSWEVKADRNDKRIQFNRPTDVREKTGLEKGKYQHPEYYGLGPELGMDYDPSHEKILKEQRAAKK